MNLYVVEAEMIDKSWKPVVLFTTQREAEMETERRAVGRFQINYRVRVFAPMDADVNLVVAAPDLLLACQPLATQLSDYIRRVMNDDRTETKDTMRRFLEGTALQFHVSAQEMLAILDAVTKVKGETIAT